MKLQTPVIPPKMPFSIGLYNSIMVLGSCFADNIGARMSAAGMDVCVNPFGTLYNPVSVLDSLARLSSGEPFAEEDCESMGSGSPLVCSFSHHTSFARPTAEEFLEGANEALAEASAQWQNCDRLIVTLGTSWVWEREGRVVSNCLKRDAREFTHRALSLGEIELALRRILVLAEGRKVLFTVSPVRHLWNGAHSNNLSKAALMMAIDDVIAGRDDAAYFPAYEIVMDELRDYRFFGEDMIHPTAVAVGCVWERFCESVVPSSDLEAMAEAEKASRAAAHRPLR